MKNIITIDCSNPPKIIVNIPYEHNLRVYSQNEGIKNFIFDLSKIQLYLAPEQENGIITSSDLEERLKNKYVLDANILLYLLEHQELIKSWNKEKNYLFWGTMYHHPLHSEIMILGLEWNQNFKKWTMSWNCLYKTKRRVHGCGSDSYTAPTNFNSNYISCLYK